MARFEAFRGTTYDKSRLSPDDVVAPPYDVVSPAMRSSLAARSSYNSIHVELPEPAHGLDRYEHAAQIWRAWHDEGAVRLADTPSFYVYRMSFLGEDGSPRTTTGILGALDLDPRHDGDVLLHEETTPKDRSDRLSLLSATRANLSPIWGLSLAGGLGRLAEEAFSASEEESFLAHDENGGVHEVIALCDPGLQTKLTELVASSPVLLADGHHRYETACAYAEQDAASRGAGQILAFLSELSAEQLSVEAIHRLVTGVSEEELASHLEGAFELLPGPPDAEGLRGEMTAAGALGLLGPAGGRLLVPRSEPGPDDLDSVLLRRALLGLESAEVSYQHGLDEVTEAISTERAAAAVLLRPVSIEQIARTAGGGRRMPPKSTFFFPKLRTGLVFRELEAS